MLLNPVPRFDYIGLMLSDSIYETKKNTTTALAHGVRGGNQIQLKTY